MTTADSKGPLVGDLAGAGQIINSEIAKRTYDDALSPSMRELGGVSVDVLKTFRLFTAPIQLLAAYQDRLAAFCARVREKVPVEHQREAPAEIARPFMEAFASTSDDSPLMSMFEELMAKAIDNREADKLSPSFAEIIRTLSPLEAKLIASLTSAPQTTDELFKSDENLIAQWVGASFNFNEFGGEAHHLTISQNLKEKNLVYIKSKEIKIDRALYPTIVVPAGMILRRTKIELNMFGRWFASACVGNKAISMKQGRAKNTGSGESYAQ